MRNLPPIPRFAALFLSIAVAVQVVIALLALLAGWETGSGDIVAPMIAGMVFGQWDFEDSGTQPPPGRLWVRSARFAVVASVILALLQLVWDQLAAGGAGLAFLVEAGLQGFVVLAVLIYLLNFVMIRLGMWLGYRNATRAAGR